MIGRRRLTRLRITVAVAGMLVAGAAVRLEDHRLIRIAIGVLVVAFLMRFIPVAHEGAPPAP